jgi:hypothetical protein
MISASAFFRGSSGIRRPSIEINECCGRGRDARVVVISSHLTSRFLLLLRVQLDDWVLCRIYNKKGGLEKPPVAAADHKPVFAVSSPPEQKPFADLAAFYDRPSDSMPRLHADSSCSDQVRSPEQQLAEVQSQPKIAEWERTFASNNDPVNPAAGSMFDPTNGGPLLQDILLYWGKPF